MSSIGQDLIELAKTGSLSPLIGREKELERIFRVLGRFKEGHVLLVGEAGVGKTSLVKGLAFQISRGAMPVTALTQVKQSEFADFILNPSRLLTLSENQALPSILYVSQFDRLVEFAGNSGRFASIYDLLNHPAYRLIAAVTPQGLQRMKDTERALVSRFQAIAVNEPDDTGTIQILRGLKISYEQYHRGWIDDSALEMAVILSERYLPEQKQPSKALGLLDEACSLVAMRRPNPVEVAALEQEKVSGEEEAEIEDLIIHSPVTAFEVTEVAADITGQTVEDLERELDAEE